MRVLHVITDLKTGGAEKLMVDLLPRLRDEGHVVELCVFNGESTPFLEQLKRSGIIVHSFLKKPNYYDPLHILRLMKLCRKFDIIHTHNTAPQLFGAIVSLFVPCKWVTTEHTTTSHRRTWWFKPIEKWMYNRYERIICISKAAKQAVCNIIGANNRKVIVIANGIDLERFVMSKPIDRTSIGNTSANKRVVLMVGRYSYQKDQSTIIRAMRLLPKDTELWLAGYGETENVLFNLVSELQLGHRVFLLGMRTDIPQLLKAADVVVQSSHIEGFGMAAVEAMAADKPVIATEIPGMKEVVSGVGILFEHGNDKDLAKKIMSVLESSTLYGELIEKGKKRAELYSIKKMTDNYINAYKFGN